MYLGVEQTLTEMLLFVVQRIDCVSPRVVRSLIDEDLYALADFGDRIFVGLRFAGVCRRVGRRGQSIEHRAVADQTLQNGRRHNSEIVVHHDVFAARSQVAQIQHVRQRVQTNLAGLVGALVEPHIAEERRVRFVDANVVRVLLLLFLQVLLLRVDRLLVERGTVLDQRLDDLLRRQTVFLRTHDVGSGELLRLVVIFDRTIVALSFLLDQIGKRILEIEQIVHILHIVQALRLVVHLVHGAELAADQILDAEALLVQQKRTGMRDDESRIRV